MIPEMTIEFWARVKPGERCYRVAIVLDGSMARFYVDGKAQDTGTTVIDFETPCMEALDLLSTEKLKNRHEELRAWLAAHATEPTTIGRFDDSVLPEDELTALLRNHFFAPLDEFPKYKKMRAGDFDAESEHDEDTPDFRIDDLEEMSADQWTALQKIKKAAPEDATLEVQLRIGEWHNERITRASVLVTMERFGYTLSRAYAI